MFEPVFEELAPAKARGRFGVRDGFYGRARAWCCCDSAFWVFLGWEKDL